MRSKWETFTLDDVCLKITDGAHNSPKSVKIGKPMASVKDLTTFGVDLSNARLIDIEEYEKLVKQGCQPQVNDVLIAKDGNSALDTVCVVREPLDAVMLSSVAILRPDDNKLDPYYLKYYFSSKTIISYLKRNFISGAAIPRVVLRDFKKAEIFLPPLNKQKAISQVLRSLDDKIELNRKMNQTLEEMAQALFKSWFVDFDPVHVKAKCKSEQELEVAAAKLGISKEILDLFPSEFEESEMGMIPLGWEVKPFGELLSKTIGGDWGKEEPDAKHTEKVKIIRGTDIPKIKNISIEAVPTRYVEAKKLKTRELFDGDIVIEVSGGTKNQPTGRTLYITNEVLNMLGGKVEPASFCRLFRPINAEIGLILGQHMLHIYDQGKTWQYQNQSTGISNFQTTIFLEKENIIVPDTKVLNEFYKIVRPLIEKSLSSENITLQKTRDILLTKLLSGELDVPEVEQEKVI